MNIDFHIRKKCCIRKITMRILCCSSGSVGSVGSAGSGASSGSNGKAFEKVRAHRVKVRDIVKVVQDKRVVAEKENSEKLAYFQSELKAIVKEDSDLLKSFFEKMKKTDESE